MIVCVLAVKKVVIAAYNVLTLTLIIDKKNQVVNVWKDILWIKIHLNVKIALIIVQYVVQKINVRNVWKAINVTIKNAITV